MKKLVQLTALLVGLGIGLIATAVHADPPMKRIGQPRTDQFEIAPYGNLDQYNPLSKKVREVGVVHWSYQVVNGCSGGTTIGQTIGKAMGNIYDETGLVFIYETSGPVDLTIRTNCGSSFSAVCGTGAIGCLGRNFPYNLDIDLHSDMATYFDVSQVSIVLHELMGHALATWNEQYSNDGNFSSVSGWVDFMNTGPDSRHYIGDVERERWGRTQGAPAPERYGSDPRGFVWFCGVSSKATGIALFGWQMERQEYRFIGAIPLSALPQGSDGCRGVVTAGYVREDEIACFDIGNAVDWARDVYRSDRCVTR